MTKFAGDHICCDRCIHMINQTSRQLNKAKQINSPEEVFSKEKLAASGGTTLCSLDWVLCQLSHRGSSVDMGRISCIAQYGTFLYCVPRIEIPLFWMVTPQTHLFGNPYDRRPWTCRDRRACHDRRACLDNGPTSDTPRTQTCTMTQPTNPRQRKTFGPI